MSGDTMTGAAPDKPTSGEDLRQSEERFRLMVGAVKDYGIFLLDPKGYISSWNEGAQRIKGYTAEEIIGQHFSKFYPPEALAKNWPEHELEVAKKEGRFEDEGWRVRKDGSLFWANVVITAIRDEQGQLVGFTKVTRDLSERREQEEALRQSEERFRLMVEAVKDYGIFLLDPKGYISSWNEGAQRIKGYTAEEIIGQHFSKFYPPEALAKNWPEHELEVAKKEGRFEDEGWRVRKDGSLFWANVIITAIWNDDGELIGFTKVTRDLSERRGHEEALQQSQNRLEEANEELSRKNRELQDFAYVASHDLQEPLRKVRTFSDLLEQDYEGVVDEQGRMYLDRIRDAITRMSTLIQELLAFSRTATQQQQLQPVDLNEIIAEVVGDLQIVLDETHGKVEYGGLPTIEADPMQMRQLFQNLIGNALKYHRPDVPPVVRINATRQPNAGPLRGQAGLSITVADNGIGFDDKYAEDIFAPFRRLHARREYEGTGLGLAICRRIAERHGGTITAESRPGEGSTFTVYLPARLAVRIGGD